MTPRQERRLEEKLARKSARRALNAETITPISTANELTNTPPMANEAALEHHSISKTPISQAKLASNRVNAQHSTGAITQEGKAIVSQNATKHGLTGKFKVLAGESQSEFDQILAGFMESETPVGGDEIEMVHQMTEALWLSRRCLRLQNECFAALESGTPDEQRAAHKSLALYMRYQTTQDRTFSRYALELRKRRSERTRAERGFVSQTHKEAAERRREEMHSARQALQNVKQQSQELRNRLAAAKAEALELKNLARKTPLSDQTPELTAFVAA